MGQVIIGNSAAGLTAAETIRRIDSKCRIVIISEESYPAYSRVLTPYYISGTVPEEMLFIRNQEFYQHLSIEVMLGKRVVKIEPNRHKIVLADGKEVEFDNLLLATGSRPSFPKIKGINLKGVFGLRTLDDAHGILATIEAAKKVVVIGGGLVSLQSTQALYRRGLKKITIVVSSNHVLSQMLDIESANIIRKCFEDAGIKILTQRNAVEILGKRSVRGVVLDTGEKLECNLIIVGKGVQPNKELVEGTGINVDSGIFVDEYMRTNFPNIYAAGDVAQGLDFLHADRRINALWPNAVEEGRIAGYNMAGLERRHEGTIRMNVVEFFGTTALSIGIVDSKEKGYSHVVRYIPGEKIYKKLVLKDGLPLGAILVNDIRASGIIQSLIRRRIDVSSFQEDILDAFNYAKLYQRLTSLIGYS